ncbi:MAG: extracellular solute-binding protein [Anaerocolumna sp.]
MKLRKVLTIITIGCMVLGMFTGCSGKKQTNDSGPEVTGTEKTGTEEKESGSEAAVAEVSGNQNFDGVTLDIGIWSDDEQKRLESAFEGIEDKLGLKINFMKYPSDSDFWNNIPAQIAAGTAPDIISCTNEHYLQYIKEGLFVGLDDAIADGTINTDGILKSAFDAWKIDDVTYGIPYALNPGVFIVNNNMWNELGLGDAYPKTWDEVLSICQKVKDKAGEPALCLNVQEYHLTNYAISFGGGWGYGKTINAKANADAMQFILDAYKKGYIITPTELGLGWDGAVMIQKSALFSTGGAWYQSSFMTEAPDIKLKYLSMPTGGNSTGGATCHSAALVELKNSDAPEAVKAAIGYAFANENLYKATVEVTQVIPANDSYYNLYAEELPDLANLVGYLDNTQPFSYPAESKKFADALITAMQSAMFDEDSKTTGQEIVDSLAADYGTNQ